MPLDQNEPQPRGTATADAPSNQAAAHRLASIVLTERDVPGSLALFERSGNVAAATGDLQHYSVTFLASTLPATTPPGTLVSVYNAVTVSRTAAANLDYALSTVTAGWGGTTDFVASALGEESRGAVTTPAEAAAAPQVSSAGLVFRRQDTVVTIAVSALGPRPPIDEAVRLAQLVDAQLLNSGR